MGVTRAREELEALAGEPVARGDRARRPTSVPPSASSSAPRRCCTGSRRAPASVAFLDLDQELLAPRYRAAEQAMALLARAARLAGARRGGGRLLLQTRLPDHEVVQAVRTRRPGPAARRRGPAARATSCSRPSAPLALVSGAGATEWAAGAPDVDGIQVLDGPDATWLVRAPDHEALADYLTSSTAPRSEPGSKSTPPGSDRTGGSTSPMGTAAPDSVSEVGVAPGALMPAQELRQAVDGARPCARSRCRRRPRCGGRCRPIQAAPRSLIGRVMSAASVVGSQVAPSGPASSTKRPPRP